MKKYEHIFASDPLTHDLKNKSVRSGVYVLVSTGGNHVLQLCSIALLARMLLPEHFGLVGMVMVLTGFADRIKHLGLSTATIQQKDITHKQVSALFWVNAVGGFLITAIIAGLSWWIADFYHEPSLIAVTVTLSLSFIVGGLSVQHEALLRRQMKFKALAYVQIVANFLSILVAIALAFNGFTYWALVWKELTRSIFDTIGKWIACRWWPSLVGLSTGVGHLLRVGRNIFSVDSIYTASRGMDQLLLGKFAGAEALGLYKQAFQLMAAPMSQLTYPVGSVALPSLSALQDKPEQYQGYYKKIISLLSFVTIPLITYVAIFSEDIVTIVLGARWIDSAQILRILAVGALIEPLLSTCGMVMITHNKTERLVKWMLMYGACLVLGFAIGIQWGAIGVALGYTVAHYVLVIPALRYGFSDTPVSLTLFFRAIAVPAFVSLIMGTALVLLAHATSHLDSVSRIGLSLMTAGVLYLGLWLVVPRGRERLVNYVSILFAAFKPAPNTVTS
ncbi:MAG: lipopolysaccharide biosynthesis protein [Nitrospira sp.]